MSSNRHIVQARAEYYLNKLPNECPDDGRKFRIIPGPPCINRDTGAEGRMTISFLDYHVDGIFFRPILQDHNAVSSQDGEGSPAIWRLMEAGRTDLTASFLYDLALGLNQTLRTEYYGFIRKVLEQPDYNKLFVSLWEYYFSSQGSKRYATTPSYVGLPKDARLEGFEDDWTSSLRVRFGDELESRGASLLCNPAPNTPKFLQPMGFKGESQLLVGVHATIDAQLPNSMQFRINVRAGFRMEHDVNTEMYMSYFDHAPSWRESLNDATSNFVSVPGSSILVPQTSILSGDLNSSIVAACPTLADVLSSYRTYPISTQQPDTFDTASAQPAATAAGATAVPTDEAVVSASRKKSRGCCGWGWPKKEKNHSTHASQQTAQTAQETAGDNP